jgi:hypothetical protein
MLTVHGNCLPNGMYPLQTGTAVSSNEACSVQKYMLLTMGTACEFMRHIA